MIRPFTLLSAVIFLFSGAYLFAIKHRAEATQVRIAEIDQQSRLDAQRIRVLQAQWALETDPDRLSQLAGAFTTLQPMKPAQLVTLAALAQALPAAGAPVPGQNPAESAPVAVADAMVAAAPDAAALPLPPAAAPAAPAGARLAMLAMATPAQRPARTASFTEVEHLVHHLGEAPVRPRPAPHPVRVASAVPVHHDAVPRATTAAAQIIAARAVVAAPLGGGSLLGMAQSGMDQ